MSGNDSGAYELKHNGKIHRVPDFAELKKWVFQGRVSEKDSYRTAGASQWISVLKEPEFASVFNPEQQWTVSMQGGIFKTYDFDIVIRWAEEGRITDDAIVEGPRTPPGGVKATALPALASNLRKPGGTKKVFPTLRFDGNDYPASDTETIGKWIVESRVPVDALISFDGTNWEPVSACGLFDLEDWPRAAHGKIEESSLPEMPEVTEPEPEIDTDLHASSESEEKVITEEDDDEEEETIVNGDNSKEPENQEEFATFTVISGNSEMTIESLTKVRALLKKKLIFSYDEIKHHSIDEEYISVGEYLDSVKTVHHGKWFWMLIALGVIAIVTGLELFDVITIPGVDLKTWF